MSRVFESKGSAQNSTTKDPKIAARGRETPSLVVCVMLTSGFACTLCHFAGMVGVVVYEAISGKIGYAHSLPRVLVHVFPYLQEISRCAVLLAFIMAAFAFRRVQLHRAVGALMLVWALLYALLSETNPIVIRQFPGFFVPGYPIFATIFGRFPHTDFSHGFSPDRFLGIRPGTSQDEVFQLIGTPIPASTPSSTGAQRCPDAPQSGEPDTVPCVLPTPFVVYGPSDSEFSRTLWFSQPKGSVDLFGEPLIPYWEARLVLGRDARVESTWFGYHWDSTD